MRAKALTDREQAGQGVRVKGFGASFLACVQKPNSILKKS